MKNNINYLFLIIILGIISCEKDNYAPPSSEFSGQLVYKGEPIGVETNQVPFSIFQPGFGLTGAITGTFTPEGKFNVLVFDGDYKFTIPKNQGPFLWKELSASARDSVAIKLRGKQVLDVEVLPYYMIRKPQFSFTNGAVSATFDIEKVITDAVYAKNIQTVSLFINKTVFVSNNANEKLAQIDLAGTAIKDFSNQKITVIVPTNLPVASEKYVFARIGIRISGVEDWIYSPVQKLSL